MGHVRARPVRPGVPQKLTPRRELWLLLTLAGIQFTHILDFMIMMPLGPVLRQVFSITDAQFGLLVSAYTLAAGVSGLVASTYIDRHDRKRLVLTLYVLFALATLACALAPTYTALMVARLFAGAFGGVLGALSHTIVADAIPFERRGRAMGVVMSSFSVSTVAGVPIGLWLATEFNWHAPFFMLALLCAVLAFAAAQTLPTIDSHLAAAREQSPWANIAKVLQDSNHLRAFGFSAAMMFAGFVFLPFLTLYITSNVGLKFTHLHWMYLLGGVATLFTARLIGKLSDSKGKLYMYRVMAAAVCVPILVISNLPEVPIWALFIVTTAMFICMSGRMIPGGALVGSTANPDLRGTFMSLNGSMQSLSMGVASFVGGLIIGRDGGGFITHFWVNGLVGAAASLLSLYLAAGLVVRGGVDGEK